MGTLYDLLGALPGDDAEGLRTAFRRAAKATHPDMNPDDPEASRRFRELMRAYDILNDADQRTTYDELLLIALHPPTTKSTRVYERVRKYASNTMAATIISGVLVAGYTLFGHFSNQPGAAEFLPNLTASRTEQTALAATSEATVDPSPRSPLADTTTADETTVTGSVLPMLNEFSVQNIRYVGSGPRLTLDLSLIARDPPLAAISLDHDTILPRTSRFDRAFDSIVRAKRTDAKGPKISMPSPRKMSEGRVRVPARRPSMIAATGP